MVPSTKKMSTMEGIMPASTRNTSARLSSPRASGGKAGRSLGRTIDISRMKSMKIATCRIDGPIAPRYMSPTDLPSWSARTISTSAGGMTCVIVPEAAITPVASRGL